MCKIIKKTQPTTTQQQQQQQGYISSFTSFTRSRNNNGALQISLCGRSTAYCNHLSPHTIVSISSPLTCATRFLELQKFTTNDINRKCLLISQNDSMCAQISLMESLQVLERQWTCLIQVPGIRLPRFISRPRTTSTYVVFVREFVTSLRFNHPIKIV